MKTTCIHISKRGAMKKISVPDIDNAYNFFCRELKVYAVGIARIKYRGKHADIIWAIRDSERDTKITGHYFMSILGKKPIHSYVGDYIIKPVEDVHFSELDMLFWKRVTTAKDVANLDKGDIGIRVNSRGVVTCIDLPKDGIYKDLCKSLREPDVSSYIVNYKGRYANIIVPKCVRTSRFELLGILGHREMHRIIGKFILIAIDVERPTDADIEFWRKALFVE